ncbi:MAG: hypothetical protein U5K81_09540 [Trueperaceae bacterium]|nr:hypothetical protein [Trueperaceae bacterium]
MRHARTPHRFTTLVVVVLAAVLIGQQAVAQDARIGLGDIEAVETLNLFVAHERMRERGYDIELVELTGEDLATQAVANRQVDIGIGAPFTVHTRGSGTEAAARFTEQVEGIEFSELSYVPGSEVRATALLRGNVHATFLDIPNRNFVMPQFWALLIVVFAFAYVASEVVAYFERRVAFYAAGR